MENSKESTNRIVQIIGALALLRVGFFLGKNFNEPNIEIPQGVILNSGPGLENTQSVTDVFLKARKIW